MGRSMGRHPGRKSLRTFCQRKDVSVRYNLPQQQGERCFGKLDQMIMNQIHFQAWKEEVERFNQLQKWRTKSWRMKSRRSARAEQSGSGMGRGKKR